MVAKIGIGNIHFTSDFRNQIFEMMNPKQNWNKKIHLLNQMFLGPVTNDFVHDVVQTLFKIIDEQKEDHMVGTSMAMLTEIAHRISKQEIKLQATTAGRFGKSSLEDITSNILSRANINNNTVRLGIIHYLSVIKPISKVELQRTLSRFGESLLTHVFQIYFSNKKESQIALHFLNTHLGEFLAGSPAVAEMTGSVLQKQMLKQPIEFPKLMQNYMKDTSFSFSKNPALVRALGIHLSFLTKTTCEVGQKDLIKQMLHVTSAFIFSFQKSRPNEFLELKKLFLDIVSSSKTLEAKNLLLDFSKMKWKVSDSLIENHLQMEKSKSEIQITPLDEILFLAS